MCEDKPSVFLGLGITQAIIAFIFLCLTIWITVVGVEAMTIMALPISVILLIFVYVMLVLFFSGGVMAAVASNMNECLIVATMVVNIIAAALGAIFFFLVLGVHAQNGLCPLGGSGCAGFLVPLLFSGFLTIMAIAIASFCCSIGCCGAEEVEPMVMVQPRPMVQTVQSQPTIYALAPAVAPAPKFTQVALPQAPMVSPMTTTPRIIMLGPN